MDSIIVQKIQDDIRQILVVLERNTVSLSEHMRRTSALETIVEHLRKSVGKVEEQNKILNVIWKIALAFGGFVLALNQLASLLDKLR